MHGLFRNPNARCVSSTGLGVVDSSVMAYRRRPRIRLGRHSAAFTLATYVDLLDGDLSGPVEPLRTSRETMATRS
jgi:hypothetical protein